MQERTSRRTAIRRWLLLALLVAASIEGTLRLQQLCGPVLDLQSVEPFVLGVNQGVQGLHHVNRQGKNRVVFAGERRFSGTLFNKTIVREYGDLGLRINRLMPEHTEGDERLRVLFMGDSFIQGYDDANTVPYHVWSHLREVFPGIPIEVLNAGTSSYSPLLFIVQAKMLIPRLQPDLVVVDVDETDILDDAGYASGVVRDERGRIAAVNRSRVAEELAPRISHVTAASLYTVRLVRLYLLLRYRNQLIRTNSPWSQSKDYFTRLGNGKRLQKRKLPQVLVDGFAANVNELADTLLELMPGGPDSVLFIRHPHAMHVVADSNGQYWPSPVARVVGEACCRHGITFYDATADMIRMSSDPESYYWPTDMHLNFDGLQVYGGLVAVALEPLVGKLTNHRSG